MRCQKEPHYCSIILTIIWGFCFIFKRWICFEFTIFEWIIKLKSLFYSLVFYFEGRIAQFPALTFLNSAGEKEKHALVWVCACARPRGTDFFPFLFFPAGFSFTRRRHISTSGEMREESADVMSRHVATRCCTPVWQRVLRPRRVDARTPDYTNPLLLSSFFSDNNVTYVETSCNKHCVLKTHTLFTQLWILHPILHLIKTVKTVSTPFQLNPVLVF